MRVLHASRAVIFNKFKKHKFDVRPICIVTVIVRLASSVASVLRKDQIAQAVSSHQFGIGTKGGAEALIEMGDRMLKYVSHHKDIGVIKLDITNAFNSIDRERALKIVHDLVPDIYPLLYQRYSISNLLIHQDGVLDHMENGCWQGDKFSGIILSMVLKLVFEEALQCATSDLATVKVLGAGDYMDDNSTMGSLQHLAVLFEKLVTTAKYYNLEFNISKCELTVHPEQTDIPEIFNGFQLLRGCFNILNVPFGTRDYVESYMRGVYDKLDRLLDIIDKLQDHKQIQWLLISRFDNINKINYYIRNIPYEPYGKWVQLFDQLEARKRDIIFGTGLTQQQIAQTQLATKQGGLALRTPSQFYSAANLACKVKNCVLMPLLLTPEVIKATDAHVHQSMEVALQDFNSKVLPDDRISNISSYFETARQSNPYPKLQSKLFGKIENNIKSSITMTTDRHVQCLHKQFNHKKCHNWLQTDPWLIEFSNREF